MKYDYHVAVIGAGSAGLVAASTAAILGARVALIENDKMGGDCLNTGCVPSKAFLHAAHLADSIKQSHTYGIDAHLNATKLKDVMGWVQKSIDTIAPHDSREHMENLGVDVFLENARIKDAHTIQMKNQTITTKNIVIATGASPFVPNITGLDTMDYYTNLNIFSMTHMPKHLIVLGAGMVGLEMGQGFRHLGAEVTIIDRLAKLFVREDKEVAPIMEKKIFDDGIDLRLASDIISVRKENKNIIVTIKKDDILMEISGDALLIALGRKANTHNIWDDTVDIGLTSSGYIKTDSKMRTSVKNIYAAGDVTGPYLLTNMAGYQAGVVIKNMLFHLGVKAEYSGAAWTTYTKPEVAHVGLTEKSAKALGVFKKAVTSQLADNDRAIVQDDTLGFLKLVVGNKNTIIGATIVGDKAGELLALASIAVKRKMKISAFMSLIFSYPTISELYLNASLDNASLSIKKWHKKVLQKVLFR